MPDDFDPALESLLVDTLVERAERVPATVTLERVHARLAERGRVRSRLTVRRPLALLGLAAALMLPMAALIAGQRPSDPEPDEASQYQALISRVEGDSWRVVAMRGDGQERVVTSAPIPDPERSWPPLAVSEGGWLAVPGATGWEFRDLRSPDRAIGPIAPFLAGEYGRGSSGGRAWVDGSRFATWNERGEIQLFDPAAATVEQHTVPGPLQDVDAWTSDGSRLLLYDDRTQTIYHRGERRPAEWRTVALVDEPGGRGEAATLSDFDLGWRDGLWWREDGSRVHVCDMVVRRECPGLPNGSVVVEAPSGNIAAWYTGGPATDDVVDAVFGATGLWILLDRRSDGRRVVVAHVPTPGDARTVAAWDASPDGTGSMDRVAPDDSLVVVGSRLVDSRSGRTTSIDGDLVGFVPSATADTWPGAAFQARRPVASAPPSQLTPYPTLRPLEGVLAEQLVPADRLLWREEHTAAEGPAASPTTLEIGPIELEEGLGVLLACSGPSDVLITMTGPADQDTDPGPITPLLSRCLDAEVAGGSTPSAQIDGAVRFFVTTTPDTAWQLVVYDPAPE